jgi:hypothetical protein
VKRLLGVFTALGFFVGLATGALMWGAQMSRWRGHLFSRSVVRRFAALGYISGNSDAQSTRLLRDYVSWEPVPLLRRRAEKLLERHHAWPDEMNGGQ